MYNQIYMNTKEVSSGGGSKPEEGRMALHMDGNILAEMAPNIKGLGKRSVARPPQHRNNNTPLSMLILSEEAVCG